MPQGGTKFFQRRETMNKVMMVIRFAENPEVKQGRDGNLYVRFRGACQKDRSTDADFFSFVAFGKRAEFVGRHFTKGSRIAIVGEIHNDAPYKRQDGSTFYGNTIYLEHVDFADSRSDERYSDAPDNGMYPAPAAQNAGMQQPYYQTSGQNAYADPRQQTAMQNAYAAPGTRTPAQNNYVNTRPQTSQNAQAPAYGYQQDPGYAQGAAPSQSAGNQNYTGRTQRQTQPQPQASAPSQNIPQPAYTQGYDATQGYQVPGYGYPQASGDGQALSVNKPQNTGTSAGQGRTSQNSVPRQNYQQDYASRPEAAQPAQAASAPSKDSGQQEAGFSDLNAFINIPDGALDEELPFA